MGGYPNPRDCSKCICPDGYGGRLCDEKPSGCGKVYRAKSKVQILEQDFGESGEESDDFTKCTFWIKADKGRKIEMRLKDAVAEVTSDSGCVFCGSRNQTLERSAPNGLQILHKQGGEDKVFVSKTDTVPVILYRSMGMVMATLEYRMSMF
ncbi:unnamed protein product [Cylicocyclus nassatus]|uniref:CUB domain-containing protein n=1 Tax=Cylicocyclus nassatus TaxID=53992 RepID=A0AA36ME37_CYLNA|nr:unnamed protein product [Cylicocyclus nassatus]